MAQLMGDTDRAFAVQAQRGYAEATERLTQAASAGRDEIATRVPAKETAEKRAHETWVAATDTIAEMNHARVFKDEEVMRLLNALTQAQASIAQSQAEQVSKIAQA